MDILIWQRIFETHRLFEMSIGVYHWGWLHSLFGFMSLGVLLCYPSLRRMITFPISLAILAFSGLEDCLYYWLDGKALPAALPWLSSNPLLLKPVTFDRLVLSASFWILLVVALDIASAHLEAWLKAHRARKSSDIVVEAIIEPMPVEVEA
jgi:hypothetical protein